MSFEDYGHLFPHYSYRYDGGTRYRELITAFDTGETSWETMIASPHDLSCSLCLARLMVKSERYDLDVSLSQQLQTIRNIGPTMVTMWQDYLGLDLSLPPSAISQAHRTAVADLFGTLAGARCEFEQQPQYEQLVQAKVESQPRPTHLRHIHQPQHSEQLMDALFDDVRHSGVHVDRERSLAHTVTLTSLDLTNPEMTYALQASCDFVLWYGDGDHRRCCVIEIDGSSHRRLEAQTNDAIKNQICRAAGVPLIRISDRIFNDPDYEHYLSSLIAVIVTSSSADTVYPLCQAVSDGQPLSQYVRWYDQPMNMMN